MLDLGGSDGPLNEEGCLSGYGNVRGCLRREKCAEKSAFNTRSASLHVAKCDPAFSFVKLGMFTSNFPGT